MAKVLSLAPCLTPQGVARLNDDLMARSLHGEALGPRGHHIRSVGMSLEASVTQLRAALAGSEVGVELDAFLRQLDALVHVSKSYVEHPD